MSETISQHPAFEHLRHQNLDSLNISVDEYRHKVTGASHYHFNADSSENSFLVALRTVPTDSTGVAHMLEHTALCGSEKFPVRDPFFMMLRRSLNTFMNAMTSSDWTAYPFASCNRKDFDNLLSVYLDAVFFSRLDPLDFAQEGHRLEFEETDNPDSPLVYKGVVFNEMKGAMSSVPSTLWHTLCHHLFPTSTYHFNSGGEPEDIPKLSYEELVSFYKTHYHPGNAIFMTFGDIPASEHHKDFEERALHRFDAPDTRIDIGAEQRYTEAQRVSGSYALDEEESSDNKSHVVMAWLWGETGKLDDLLEAQLLSGVLLDNSASPLRQALETTDLGTATSPLCGLEDSNRELTFVCGLEGTAKDATEQAEALIVNTLTDIATQGVELEDVQAVLHQLELHQREISGDSYPYGMQLMLQSLSPAVHRGDPIAVLDLDPVLESLHQQILDPEYIPELIHRLILNNNHRVTLTMHPDATLAEQKNQRERDQLANIKAALNEQQSQDIIELSHQLAERQEQEDDPSLLPKVGLEDVPDDTPEPVAKHEKLGAHKLTHYDAGTNGLVYQHAVLSLPELDKAEREILPYYCNYVTELGIGEADYLRVQQRQAAVVGSLNSYSSLRSLPDDCSKLSGHFTLSAKALVRNTGAMTQLMRDTLEQVRFDELPRLTELVAQNRARRDQSVTGSGHALAMLAASRSYSPLAEYSHHTGGLAGIGSLRSLDDGLKNAEQQRDLSERMQQLHNKLISTPIGFLNISDPHSSESCIQSMNDCWGSWPEGQDQGNLNLVDTGEAGHQIWQASTQVNFCSLAFATVPMTHADAAPLTVLGGFLRNSFLHRAIREQGGAYGSGAGQESNLGVFRFFSYRDPRLTETVADFRSSIEWLLGNPHDERLLEEAILGVIGSIDKIGSPAGEARQHFYNSLGQRTHAQRMEYRDRLLGTTIAQLKDVAERYLTPDKGSIAYITNDKGVEKLADFNQQDDVKLYSLQ
ncbi:MAG: insulinase family protein [Pseudomonadales bacterium]